MAKDEVKTSKHKITHLGACTGSNRKNQAMRRSEKRAKRRNRPLI